MKKYITFEDVREEKSKCREFIYFYEAVLCELKARLENLNILADYLVRRNPLPFTAKELLRDDAKLQYCVLSLKRPSFYNFDELVKNSKEKEINPSMDLKEKITREKIELLERVKDYFCEEVVDEDEYPTLDTVYTKDAVEIAQFIDRLIEELEEKK